MLAPCMDQADRACLYHRLDRESRWALQTIHKTLVEMRTVVDASYPESRRTQAFGTWGEEARTNTPEEMFKVFCRKRKCLTAIAAGFGAVKAVSETETALALVETIRGKSFEMARFDGKWGLSIFQKELLAAKLRFIDSLKQVQRNAKAFEEQRVASENTE